MRKLSARAVLALLLAALLMGASFGSALAASSYNMPYYIEVDIANQIVTVYNTSDGTIARQMLTSSGMNNSTPLGTFYLMENGRASERGEWTWFQQYHCFVKFATRIYQGYMFHSLPFAKKDESTMLAWRNSVRLPRTAVCAWAWTMRASLPSSAWSARACGYLMTRSRRRSCASCCWSHPTRVKMA